MKPRLVTAIEELNADINKQRQFLEAQKQDFEHTAETEGVTAAEERNFYYSLDESLMFLKGMKAAVNYLELMLTDEEREAYYAPDPEPKKYRFYYSPTQAARRPDALTAVVVDGKEIVYTEYCSGSSEPICEVKDAVLVYESDDIPHIRIVEHQS